MPSSRKATSNTLADPGDYNGNGVVDAATTSCGENISTLRPVCQTIRHLGTVTQADYDVCEHTSVQTAGSGLVSTRMRPSPNRRLRCYKPGDHGWASLRCRAARKSINSQCVTHVNNGPFENWGTYSKPGCFNSFRHSSLKSHRCYFTWSRLFVPVVWSLRTSEHGRSRPDTSNRFPD